MILTLSGKMQVAMMMPTAVITLPGTACLSGYTYCACVLVFLLGRQVNPGGGPAGVGGEDFAAFNGFW